MKLLLALLFTLPCLAQNTGNCSRQWLRADYAGLEQAQAASLSALQTVKAATAHDTVIAKALTTLGIYNDYAGNREQALRYYNKALQHLKSHKKLQLLVYLNTASAYEGLGSYSKMLAIAKKAQGLNGNYGTPTTKALIYQAIATYYFRTGNMAQSAGYLLKGIAILEKEKNTCYLPALKLNLANTYIQTNNYAFAIDLFKDYLQHNPQAKGTRLHTIAIINYTECLIELNQLQQAFSLLQNAVPNVIKASDSELEAVLYYRLGNVEFKSHHTESSLTYYKKAYTLLGEGKSRYATNVFSDYLNVLDKAHRYDEAMALMASFKNSGTYRRSNTQERYEYESAAAKIYGKTGHLKEGNRCLTEALRLCDSLRLVGNGKNEEEIQARYQTKFQREKNIMLAEHNKVLKKKIATEELLILMYAIISVGIIILVLLYLRGYRLRHRLQKERLKNLEADKVMAQQQRDYEQEISSTQKMQIEGQQREVTSMALRLANYYDNINELLEKINTFKAVTDVKKELQQLVKQKDYWKQFETRFNTLNPEFALTLNKQFPKLTKNDIEFCSLIKLKLSNKEIASLLQISHESVITKKYRIRKKMELQDDADFEQLLMEI